MRSVFNALQSVVSLDSDLGEYSLFNDLKHTFPRIDFQFKLVFI